MTKKERYKKVTQFFESSNPFAETELEYTDPFARPYDRIF